ncbi:hypothetical protein [Nocardia salmonicida]|uniref:hypothetical protein n=1 Tax=Nocardia salmonicida TaxID=53431 RepID=UPI003439C977
MRMRRGHLGHEQRLVDVGLVHRAIGVELVGQAGDQDTAVRHESAYLAAVVACVEGVVVEQEVHATRGGRATVPGERFGVGSGKQMSARRWSVKVVLKVIRPPLSGSSWVRTANEIVPP